LGGDEKPVRFFRLRGAGLGMGFSPIPNTRNTIDRFPCPVYAQKMEGYNCSALFSCTACHPFRDYNNTQPCAPQEGLAVHRQLFRHRG